MTKWEFLTQVYRDEGELFSLVETLNRLGALGWQVASAQYLPDDKATRYLMQRPLSE